MLIKNIIDTDFINYKKPCMTIECPFCDFKCEQECNEAFCQNSELAKAQNYNISNKVILDYYFSNPITKAICFQGLEPFDSWNELLELIKLFRLHSEDDIIIYTGYNENEVINYIAVLAQFSNIYIKFGRYIPNQKSHYDKILGVNLVSPNQYCKKISQA
jgi:hypothetical protein